LREIPTLSSTESFKDDLQFEEQAPSALFPPPYVLHFDNASPHKSHLTSSFLETYGIKSLAAPAYSPDLAPSDFFLFGYMKSLLKGTVFANEDDLKEAIDSILRNISSEILRRSFLNWKKRCIAVAKNGEYYS
jgi:histone-lysine N-methyltransferase SETMAR